MTWLILIIFCILGLFLGGCSKPKPPNPDPDPEPSPSPNPEDSWIAYYPIGYTIPIVDWDKSKWQERDDHEQEQVDNIMLHFMNENDRTDIDDLTLSLILFTKVAGEYYFRWTSDMQTWNYEDYWATPYQFVITKEGKGDCDDFCGLHCDYLYELCQYYLVWWCEVYWQRKITANGVDSWKSLGHAITCYKRSSESNWRCFSNQSLLGRANGFETIEEIIRKFCPNDDDHRLIKVAARHPMTGKLLWERKG